MILSADNLNVVHPDIGVAVQKMDPKPIREMVKRCCAAGAQAIDINSGPLPREAEKRFAFLVETVQAETDLPLVLDTVNPDALEAGLAVCRNRTIINGFSLEPFKLERILPLAARYEVEIVGYLLDAQGRVPLDPEDLMTLAVSLMEAYHRYSLPADRLFIDPVVAPVAWEDGIRHNRAVLSVLRRLQDLLGEPVRTVAGLSNLSSGAGSIRRKIALETTFLPMLAAAGLDMVLLDVFHAQTVRNARRCELLLGQKIFSWAAIEDASRCID